MMIATGIAADGLNSSATTTGGTHDTNGPKNGMACSMPAATVVRAAYSSPNTMFTTAVIRPIARPMIPWPRMNPPNDRATLVWSSRASVTNPGGTRRNRKVVMASRSDGDVDRQDHEDQDVAEDADARDRQRLERPDELAAHCWRFVDDHGRLVSRGRRQAERGQARLDLGEQVRPAGPRTVARPR